MPISASTLSALQKAGTAIFHADEKLKSEVAAYAQRANAAVLNNPYNLGNAVIIESWQVTARLSKKLSGIEEELRELYRIAGELTEEDLPIVRETRALSAPASVPTSTGTKKAAKKTVAKAVDLSATTVKVKKATRKQAAKATKAPTAAPTTKTATPPAKSKKTTAKAPTGKPTGKAPVTQPATKAIAKVAKVKAGTTAVATQELKGNPAKLLAYLLTILNTDKFEHINQTAIAKDTNIPVGSMNAALARLIKEGRLVAGPQGSFKLAKVAVKATKKSAAPAKPSAKTPAKALAKAPTPASTPAPASTTAAEPAPAPAPAPAQPEVQAVTTPEAQA